MSAETQLPFLLLLHPAHKVRSSSLEVANPFHGPFMPPLNMVVHNSLLSLCKENQTKATFRKSFQLQEIVPLVKYKPLKLHYSAMPSKPMAHLAEVVI